MSLTAKRRPGGGVTVEGTTKWGVFEASWDRDGCLLDQFCDPRDPTSCTHRGDVVREKKCETCRNKRTTIKVFACAVHGECQIGKRLDGVTSCRDCKDFQAKD